MDKINVVVLKDSFLGKKGRELSTQCPYQLAAWKQHGLVAEKEESKPKEKSKAKGK